MKYENGGSKVAMGKSAKTIMVLGIFTLLFMMVMYLFLIQSSASLEESDLSAMIEVRFDLEKVIIVVDYGEKGLRYRITCNSQKPPEKDQLKSIGNYVWQNYPSGRKPEQVLVVYRKYETGCTYREKIYREKVMPPSNKNQKIPKRQRATK